MSDAATARTDHELQVLESLVDCAKTISLAIGEAAKVETDQVRQLELFDAFQRGFFSVRMGIRLALTLRAGPRPVASPVGAAPAIAKLVLDRLETETPETERAEGEKPDHEPRLEREREREREYEAVSLPMFLKTLGVVSTDAARLDGLPAHVRAEVLPTLDRLLARAKADAPPTPASLASSSATGVDLLLRPPPADSKRRLLGSAVLPKALPLTGPTRPRPPPYRFC